jgi:hypothetical protein
MKTELLWNRLSSASFCSAFVSAYQSQIIPAWYLLLHPSVSVNFSILLVLCVGKSAGFSRWVFWHMREEKARFCFLHKARFIDFCRGDDHDLFADCWISFLLLSPYYLSTCPLSIWEMKLNAWLYWKKRRHRVEVIWYDCKDTRNAISLANRGSIPIQRSHQHDFLSAVIQQKSPRSGMGTSNFVCTCTQQKPSASSALGKHCTGQVLLWAGNFIYLKP